MFIIFERTFFASVSQKVLFEFRNVALGPLSGNFPLECLMNAWQKYELIETNISSIT